jgi:tetratricopeptide (TPR) repeat protein
MSARIPIVKRAAWPSLIPQLLLMFGLILLFWLIKFTDQFNLAVVYGTLAYLVYSFGSKAIILRHHRQGMNLSKLGRFREATDEFKASHAFFSEYWWIDKYRFITMLDSSAISYREMALCNTAFSYIQLNETAKAEQFYRKALQEFPDSEIAKSGLEYIQSNE